MYFNRTIYLLIFFFICILHANGQSFKYTQYTTYNGLPIDNVYAATQDENGFLWIGTDFGISKFDGYQFTNFNRSNGIATKAITDIIYAGGDSSIFLSYPNSIQSIHGNGVVNTIVPYSNISLEQLIKHGNKYFFYQRNLYLYGVLENGKVLYYDIRNTLKIKDVVLRSITSLHDKGILFCTNKGIFLDNNKNVKQLLPNEDVYYVLYKKNKTILAATTTHVKNSDTNFNFNTKDIPLPNKDIIYNMVEDANNNVWLRAIGKGIYRLSNYKLLEQSELLDMKNKEVNKFFIDKQNNTWFCTSGSGLLFKGANMFANYETNDGLANNKVLQLFTTKSKIVIGTANGVSVMDGNNIKQLKLPKANNGLQYVYKLFKDSTTDFGICMINTFPNDTNKFNKIIKTKIDGYNITPVNGLMGYQKKENTYWVFNTLRLALVENNKVANIYSLREYNIRKLYDIIEYQNKTFVASADGMIVIENQKLQYIPSIANQKLGEVFQFLIDKNNKLWIATENGLITYQNNKYSLLPKASTSGGNYCKGITLDNENNIWCATWDGIFETNGITKKTFSTYNGLASKTCHSILYDSASNQLYIGTDNGLSVINKNMLEANKYSEMLYVNAYWNDLPIANNSTLKSNQTSLNFYCNIPNFEVSKNIVYEYKLDYANWIQSTTPLIKIQDIDGGSHILKIRAKLSGEIINEKEFKFSIKNKFYNTWWFWILTALGLQYIIYKIINYYNKKERERKNFIQKQDIELTTLKQQAFTSLMNPHFIFNALNSIQHYINKQDRLMANKYLSDFAMLVRKSFDAAQKPFVPLEDEIETMRLYLQLEQMRFTNKFEYSININESVDEDDWMLPSMVLQPFLENAIIHGIAPLEHKGIIELNITAKEKTLYITITDNGIGIQASQQQKGNSTHQSKGMFLIKERLQLLSRYSPKPIELDITNNNGGGTCILLTVPQSVIDEYVRMS